MEDFLDLLLLLNAVVVGIECRVSCFQKLLKVQRIDVEQVDHANRVGFRFRQKCAEQTPCCNDMILICLFFKIFKCVQSLRAFLYLIKDDQSLSRQNLLPTNQGEQFQDALRVLIRLEDGFQFVLFVEVEINETLIIVLSELLHQPCLTNLACAFQDKRFPFLVIFPVDQILNRIAFHGGHHPFKGMIKV